MTSIHKGFIKLSTVNGAFDKFDAICVVSQHVDDIAVNSLADVHADLKAFHGLTGKLNDASIISVFPSKTGKLIVHLSVGSNDGDFDDARAFIKAGIAVVHKALASSAHNPMFVIASSKNFPNARLLTLLGILHAAYTPLNIRERKNGGKHKIDEIHVYLPEMANEDQIKLIKLASGFQEAFQLCRDIGDADPMRMAPRHVADHVLTYFSKSENVKVDVIENEEIIRKEYPLLAAVNRGANEFPEHKVYSYTDFKAQNARVIWLEYKNDEVPESKEIEFETLFLVGKGVTMDTGGTDVKIGSAMFGMSRDKYGSAVVAGFFAALDSFRPRGIHVRGAMCMVRNNVDGKSYTCDEIIMSRSGKLVQVYNTDAEGRLAMVDPLAQCREEALNAKHPHLFTIATLTGHCVISYGNRSAIVDNGPAHGYALQLQKTGDAYGQPVEISRLAKEDFAFHKAESEMAELRQANLKPSVQTPRGHITPAAFLILGSRLDEHSAKSATPLPYTHIDIGCAMGEMPQVTFPNPLLTLVAHHVLPRI